MTLMDWILLIASCTMLVAMILVLMRAIAGPTVYDRILAVNAIGTKTVMFVVLLAFLNKRADYLDIALLYALINFSTTIAILKFKEFGRLG